MWQVAVLFVRKIDYSISKFEFSLNVYTAYGYDLLMLNEFKWYKVDLMHHSR